MVGGFGCDDVNVIVPKSDRKALKWITLFRWWHSVERQMSVEPNDLMLFARVVDAGSFSRAAERVGLPKSTVSRRIAQLESQLGERLLLRTTRKLTVTDFGHSVLEHREWSRSVSGE